MMTEPTIIDIFRLKAFDAAMEFARRDGGSTLADALCDARLAERYLSGVAAHVEIGPVEDEIPNEWADQPAGEVADEIMSNMGETVEAATAELPPVIKKPRAPKAKKAAKAKARRAKPNGDATRDAGPATSQDNGSPVPDNGNTLPAEDFPQAA